MALEPSPRFMGIGRDAALESTGVETASFKLITYAGELDRIAGWAGDMPYEETGGDLFGFWTHSGMPVVQFVLGPGPRAQRRTDAFFQDTAYLQEVGGQINARHGLQYIGEWHSHHQFALDRPSPGDCRTVDDVFRRHEFDRFVLCIVNLRPDGDTWSLWRRRDLRAVANAFMFVRDAAAPARGKWVILDGQSPIAQTVRADLLHDQRTPPQTMAWDVERTSLAAAIGSAEPQRRPSTSRLLYRPEEQRFFHELQRGCEQYFGPTRLSQLPNDGVVLQFGHDGYALSVTFPAGYPHEKLALAAQRGTAHETWEYDHRGGEADALLATLKKWGYETVPALIPAAPPMESPQDHVVTAPSPQPPTDNEGT